MIFVIYLQILLRQSFCAS